MTWLCVGVVVGSGERKKGDANASPFGLVGLTGF